MKSIIHFYISKGEKQYVAEGVEFAIVTQAKTLDGLMKNIHEATEMHLESSNHKDTGFIKSPIISVNFEFPQLNFTHA